MIAAEPGFAAAKSGTAVATRTPAICNLRMRTSRRIAACTLYNPAALQPMALGTVLTQGGSLVRFAGFRVVLDSQKRAANPRTR
jgi:hypothetical protein